VGVRGHHRQAVAGADEEAAPEDHVAVPVAIRCSAEVRRIAPEHELAQFAGVGKVGVGMAPTEIGQGFLAHHGARRCAKAFLQDLHGVGSGDGVHGIEPHAEAVRLDQCAHGREIEQRVHQVGVVGDRVHDLDLHLAELLVAHMIDIHVRRPCDPVVCDLEAGRVDGAGDRLRCRPAVGDVELDAEIALRTARVVAGRENDAAPAWRVRIRWLAAGVDRMPPQPTVTLRIPLATAMRRMIWTASRLKNRPSPPRISSASASAFWLSKMLWTKFSR
jgi:hypothetical protein